MTYITFIDAGGMAYRSDTDLGLIIEHVTIGSPAQKKYTVDIPYMNGVLDYSAEFGEPALSNRPVTISAGKSITDRAEQEANVYNALHGKRMKVTISTDPDWHWYGFVNVDGFDPDAGVLHGTITVDAEPYKLKTTETTVTKTLTTSYQTVTLTNKRKRITPEVTSSVNATIKVGTTEIAVPSGRSRPAGLILQPGSNTIQVKGNSSGTMTIKYREGSL